VTGLEGTGATGCCCWAAEPAAFFWLKAAILAAIWALAAASWAATSMGFCTSQKGRDQRLERGSRKRARYENEHRNPCANQDARSAWAGNNVEGGENERLLQLRR
jgi:hypothetical protein